MLYTIKNDYLEVQISDSGAEIKSIKYLGKDYLHDSDPKYWGRSAPLLWPNIGTIKNGTATIDGISYPMKKHGFLRDTMCELEYQTDDKITFKVTSNEDTLKLYPYNFTILITYELLEQTIQSSLKFTNNSKTTMPFNLGLHPAFKVPLDDKESFEDYKIIFDVPGTYEMPTVVLTDGTIDYEKRIRTFTNLKELPLNYADYDYDALVFENIKSHQVTLTNKDETHGVVFNFEDFPMLGIWTPNHIKSPFICLEPWIGCADAPQSNGDFKTKRDLISVEPNNSKTINYSIKFF
ncbi:MAG: aldose 1-epimerase family protein [Erysipelotrichaceae bacterium]|nr:aldose 1-epimerase family protein [Erysipelotrichaceae bacterium]